MLLCIGGLPCCLVHGKPVAGDRISQIAVAKRRCLDLFLKRFRAARGRVILDRAVDKLAALAGLGRPAYRLRGLVPENDIDAFGHLVWVGLIE